MTKSRSVIRLVLNDRDIELADVAPDATLLDFLRLEQGLRGTKEGCAEGDCGACTVLVGRLKGDALAYETVNACIRFLGSLDACHVVTIEHLSTAEGALHPVQQALVDHHGSQCGFCTPGIVMSLYSLWLDQPTASNGRIEHALQGNLCRCTGYEPIVRAARAMLESTGTSNDPIVAGIDAMARRLAALRDGRRIEIGSDEPDLIVPADADDFAEVLEARPQATIVAGATDVGLWVTKHMKPIAPAVFIGHLDDLQTIVRTADGLTLGGCVSYTDAFEPITGLFPQMAELWDRIGGAQVRNMGTIGGNIANGSPIGDTPPPFIALGATLTLRRGSARRTVPLETFFIDYGRQDRAPGEFVEAVDLPALAPEDRFAVYKISKRRDEDISALCGAFRVRLDGDRVVRDACIAFGGMAATPKRARAVEQALVGQPWSEENVEAARLAFADDYKPLTDWRASSEYRLLAARNLLARFYHETSGDGSAARLDPSRAA